MNREIKFRGWFQGVNGQEYWVYGYLVKQTNGNWEITNGDTSWTVDNVGQFTGLVNEKGKEIYEGDIFKYSIPDDEVEFIEEVNFNLGSFDLDNAALGAFYDCGIVIGNIYENPELISDKN